MLHELPGYTLATPIPPTPADAYETAKGHFEAKQVDVRRWLATAEFQSEQSVDDAGFLKLSAFSLHQAAETAYASFLLVQTFHFPRSHNLKFLRSLAEDKERRLVEAWPRETKLDRRRFELLKRAYVEARYSDAYEISADDLAALAASVGRLRSIVDEVCRERIEALRLEAEAHSP
jgi:HEPN domain-containing protein